VQRHAISLVQFVGRRTSRFSVTASATSASEDLLGGVLGGVLGIFTGGISAPFLLAFPASPRLFGHRLSEARGAGSIRAP